MIDIIIIAMLYCVILAITLSIQLQLYNVPLLHAYTCYIIGTMNWMAPEILEATSPQYPYICIYHMCTCYTIPHSYTFMWYINHLFIYCLDNTFQLWWKIRCLVTRMYHLGNGNMWLYGCTLWSLLYLLSFWEKGLLLHLFFTQQAEMSTILFQLKGSPQIIEDVLENVSKVNRCIFLVKYFISTYMLTCW